MYNDILCMPGRRLHCRPRPGRFNNPRRGGSYFVNINPRQSRAGLAGLGFDIARYIFVIRFKYQPNLNTVRGRYNWEERKYNKKAWELTSGEQREVVRKFAQQMQSINRSFRWWNFSMSFTYYNPIMKDGVPDFQPAEVTIHANKISELDLKPLDIVSKFKRAMDESQWNVTYVSFFSKNENRAERINPEQSMTKQQAEKSKLEQEKLATQIARQQGQQTSSTTGRAPPTGRVLQYLAVGGAVIAVALAVPYIMKSFGKNKRRRKI